MTDQNNRDVSESDLVKVYGIVKQYRDGKRDFQGINLNEANLSRIVLRGANLSGASLCVANMGSADLSEANLSDANLNVVRLSSANLTRAILNRATINVANLVRSDLSEAQLVGALLIRAELIRAKLHKANFAQANLNGADLRESKLQQANFGNANLSGANLRGASGAAVNFRRADLRGADLVKANLPKSDFCHGELRQANLTYANLSGADLRGANLRWSDLRGADLSAANLSEANLSGANLCGANLNGATLIKASLVHADLTQTNLIRASWGGADLSGATLTGAKLYQVCRFNLKAEEISCEWVDLSPNGDHSEVYHFDRDRLKKFFNQTRPKVQIVVDSPLDHEANLVLAATYQKIAGEFPVMARPPSVEVGDRTTSLIFAADREEDLFPIGCMAVLPFDDATGTQKNIVTLLRQLQSSSLKPERRTQLLSAMGQVIARVNDIKKLVRSTRSESIPSFFRRPTATQLTNSSQKTLTVYQHPQMDKIGSSSILESARSEPATESSLPELAAAIAFIESFDETH
ncbi:pentapeptide repeat-containing protein [Lyngbya sp. CCY1209]|uniref:pentapeptide repeat-containing protein n=1 Tax=Lyngbya sp. CCY1209 TaxID=2886103 RepID=UPI002D20E69C|nr:pentapeptide repeat-containing protein [Lyngbya sp. CCY1209]MEB3882498.1 pentapeptide repeat-containing protein [Lyngbya sp. CCY1209]